MMHDVNIKEIKKNEIFSFSLVILLYFWDQADQTMRDINAIDRKNAALALSLFSIAEIEPTEHRETVMHDVNIKDMMKVNH